jgi:hypothetical protein
MKAWKSKLGPAAKESTKIQNSFIMQGAALHIHSVNGQKEMLQGGSGERLSIPSV